jgi:hypothetical protein
MLAHAIEGQAVQLDSVTDCTSIGAYHTEYNHAAAGGEQQCWARFHPVTLCSETWNKPEATVTWWSGGRQFGVGTRTPELALRPRAMSTTLSGLRPHLSQATLAQAVEG